MSGHKILIVEDDTLAGEDLRYQLEHLGYEVSAIVTTAIKAIQAVELLTPDLILMDVFLEGEIDGIQAATQIRERWDVPVVFMSIYSDKDVLERAKLTQPFGYIVKPYTERELHAVLSMALYRASAERKIRQSSTVTDALDALGAALIRTDNKGRVIFASEFAQNLLGKSFAQMEGQWLPRLIQLLEEGQPVPLGEHISDVVEGRAVRIKKNQLILVIDHQTKTLVDMTVAASVSKGVEQGTAVLLQPNAALDDTVSGDTSPGRESSDSASIDAFIATVSHDLRAPLGALQRFSAGEALGVEDSKGTLAPLISKLQQAQSSMQSSIQDLVLYMRLGRGELPLSPVPLSESVADAVEQLSPRIAEQAVRVQIEKELPTVLAHQATLTRAITYLIKNIIDAASPTTVTTITIDAENNDYDAHLSIQQTTGEISGHVSDHVTGAGFGLRFAQRALTWMGGDAGKSQGPASACGFWLHLPTSP